MLLYVRPAKDLKSEKATYKRTFMILICKAENSIKQTSDFFKAQGFTCAEFTSLTTTKLTDFETNLSLLDITKFNKVLVTSAETVAFLNNIKDKLINLDFIAVGSKTAEDLKYAGFNVVESGLNGAEDLIQKLISAGKLTSTDNILHLSGEIKQDDFYQVLTANNITITNLAVYQTIYIEDFSEDLINQLNSGEISTILLFSAKSTESFSKLLNSYKINNKFDFICLSKAVADKIDNKFAKMAHIAEQTDLKSILTVLKQNNLG